MDQSKILDYCLHCDELEKFCGQQSDKINGLCGAHQEFIDSLPSYIEKEKQFCVTVIKDYLSTIEIAVGKVNKAKYANEMFEFMCKHKKLIFDHSGLLQALLKKLEELDESDGDIVNAQKFMNILFPFREQKKPVKETSQVKPEDKSTQIKTIPVPSAAVKERVNIIIFEALSTSKFTTLDVAKSTMATIYDYIELEYGTVAKETAAKLYGDQSTQDKILKDNNTAGICIIKINDNLYEMYTKNITKVNNGWIRNNFIKTVKAEKVGRFIVPYV